MKFSPAVKKQKAIQAYRNLSRQGELIAAHRVLHLLQTGRVYLGLGDNDFAAECALEKVGLDGVPGRNYMRNRFSIQ
nr:hypothetical protein [uncultured Desulfobulbus sp.]